MEHCIGSSIRPLLQGCECCAEARHRVHRDAALTQRTQNNPYRPADKQKTAKAADQLVGCRDLLEEDKGADTRDPQQIHYAKGEKETH